MKALLAILILAGSVLQAGEYIEADPDSLGTNPEDYIGVEVKIKCRFVKIDSTWLGDNDVFRSPRDYLGFTVQAGDRIFAQLFAPRSLQEELERFDKGDRMLVYGRVFSSRYNFPWIDVDRVSEGWVVGEESERIRRERREMARNYEEFLKAREGIIEEVDLEEVREMRRRQEALIELLIGKGVITRSELEDQSAALEAAPTPIPAWQRYLETSGLEDEAQ